MKVSGRCVLDAFCSDHPHAKHWIEQWLSELEEMSWTSPNELRAKYRTVLIRPGNRALFEVLSGEYWLEVTVAYKSGTVCVRWAGTRSDYERRPASVPDVSGM